MMNIRSVYQHGLSNDPCPDTAEYRRWRQQYISIIQDVYDEMMTAINYGMSSRGVITEGLSDTLQSKIETIMKNYAWLSALDTVNAKEAAILSVEPVGTSGRRFGRMIGANVIFPSEFKINGPKLCTLSVSQSGRVNCSFSD